MRLLIFACLLVVVYMVDYCHGDVDPFDMINVYHSTKTMKKVQASNLVGYYSSFYCKSGYRYSEMMSRVKRTWFRYALGLMEILL